MTGGSEDSIMRHESPLLSQVPKIIPPPYDDTVFLLFYFFSRRPVLRRANKSMVGLLSPHIMGS